MRSSPPLSELGVRGESTHLSTRALYSDPLPDTINQLRYECKDQGSEITKHSSGALSTFAVLCNHHHKFSIPQTAPRPQHKPH